MVAKNYVPNKGDIVWLEFDPQLGHEQKGKLRAMKKVIRLKLKLAEKR